MDNATLKTLVDYGVLGIVSAGGILFISKILKKYLENNDKTVEALVRVINVVETNSNVIKEFSETIKLTFSNLPTKDYIAQLEGRMQETHIHSHSKINSKLDIINSSLEEVKKKLTNK